MNVEQGHYFKNVPKIVQKTQRGMKNGESRTNDDWDNELKLPSKLPFGCLDKCFNPLQAMKTEGRRNTNIEGKAQKHFFGPFSHNLLRQKCQSILRPKTNTKNWESRSRREI